MNDSHIKCGDCLKLMQDIPSESIDMILCDLPYGTTACKWDSVIPFKNLWESYSRIIKHNGAIVLFSAQPFTTALIYSNMKHFRYCWYWKKNRKTGFTFAKYQPMRKIEDICVFYKKMPTYNPQGLIEVKKPKQKTHKKVFDNSVYDYESLMKPFCQKYTNYPSNILEFKKDNKTIHPTQKPVSLLEYLIKTYTNKGETVLDNCMGSGSTCIAAINTGRKYIGFELDEQYFEIAQNRINDHMKGVGNDEGKGS